MAAAGADPGSSGLLGKDDEVSDDLLNYVASHINLDKQREFSLEILGIKPQTFSSIQKDMEGDPAEINKKILVRWNDFNAVDVAFLMDELVSWQRGGYLSKDVWSSMGQFVVPYLIPEPPTTESPSGGGDQYKKTFGGSLLLGRSDEVSPALLSHVAGYLDPRKQEPFALRALKLEQSRVSFIQADFPDNSEKRNYQILLTWHNNAVGMNVGLFLERLVAWQRASYLSNDVWSQMEHFVTPDVIPDPPSPAPSGVEVARPSPTLSSHLATPSGGDTRETQPGSEQQSNNHKPIEYIQGRLKSSLRGRCKHKLSTDWLPSDEAHRFELREHFVELKQRKKVKRALRDTAENIRTIHDILKIEVAEGGVNIALQGAAGIGKTTLMAILASDWVEGESRLTKIWNFMTCRKNRLAQFSFVFLVELHEVKENSSLAHIIKEQHDLQNIPESQIRSILEGEHGQVLLLLDGYDDYKKGVNHDIDRAVEKKVGNCFLIVTSREGDHISKETLAKIDGEIELTGFSNVCIWTFAAKFLNSYLSAIRFTIKCQQAGIYGLMKVPIILLMTVVLYQESNQQLPKSLTEVVRTIIFLMIDRCTQKHFDGKKWHEIDGLEHSLKILGKLSLEALQNDRLVLFKEDVVTISPDLLKLGLLHGTFLDKAGLKGQLKKMSYPHKLFLEFMAAYFALDDLVHDIEDWPLNPVEESMQTVATFMYRMTENKHLVLEKVCDFIVVFYKKKEISRQGRYVLECFSKEDSSEINPLYNGWICSMNDYLPRSEVHSELYMFDENLPVQWKELVGRTTTLPSDPQVPCVVFVRYKTDSCLYKLLVALAHTGTTIGLLELHSIGYLYATEAQTKEPLQLQFLDTGIHLNNCDMRSTLLQNLLCLRHSRHVIDLFLSDSQHFSRTMFAALRQLEQLRALGIAGGQYDLELCQELCTLLTKLPNLECFGLFNEPTHGHAQRLSFDERVQIIRTLLSLRKLKRLFLREINLSGVLTKAFRETGSRLTCLQVLVLNHLQLTYQDILSLEKFIQEDKMPVLHELYLQRNDFTNCKVSLKKLLRTVVNKLPNCRVFASPGMLPDSSFLTTSFPCLRVCKGPVFLYTGVGTLKWRIN